MTVSSGKKRVRLAALFSVLVLVIPLASFSKVGNSRPYLKIIHAASPVNVHDPIFIDGDNQFDAAHGVIGGSGTAGDPYIIENWDISASDNHGIHIMNTTAYFIVRNCRVENGGDTYGGIRIENVQNGRIENTVIDNSYYGIFLYESTSNSLDSNTVGNNAIGIALGSSNNNVLTGNATSNNDNGIILYSSDNNTLTGNTTSNNDNYGIFLRFSDNNSFSGNIMENNTIGIALSSSSNNMLTGNTVSNNDGSGIFSHFSENNTFTGNTTDSNGQYGIYLWDSSNNLIYNNYFSNANNASDDGTNTWNIDPTPGTNIIDGPYLGGNYWSDYTGVDTDEDGLGDTELPYNSSGRIKNGGDYHPLTSEKGEMLDVWVLVGALLAIVCVVIAAAVVWKARKR